MSFPPPPHVPIIPPMPFLPPGAPMMMPIVPPANGTHRPGENEKKNKFQVPTTVFVGSISDRAPDVMIKRMLQNCGSVMNWKRVQGANGKLQAFGFCEYENPEGTLRCIRLLNGWQIQDKNLVVKVDAKTKALLDEYKKKKRQELAKKAANDTTAFKFIYEEDEDEDGDEEKKKKTNSSDGTDGKVKKSGEEGEIEEEEDDYLDEATRREDHAIRQSLETIMREYSREMNQRALEQREVAAREAQAAATAMPPVVPPISTPPPPVEPNATSPVGKRIDSNVSIDDEEGKRSLITNEIQMFRDRFKDEDTKMRNTEKERKDRYERERALQREKRLAEETPTGNISPSSRDASPPSSRERSSPSRRNRRDRSPPSDDRYRNSSSRNHNSNSVRSRTNDRRSSPSNRYDRRPSPPSRSYNRRSRTKSPVGRAHSNDGDDDETYERKKQEKRLKEKEARYRDRLKTWTQRERKKQTDYENEKERELARVRDEEKEGKRLLGFLEEYKDEIEDSKHYKGNGLVRRLKDREHEIELDNRDRRHEKEEIEELRQKLLQENVSDVEGEIKRRLEKDEEQIRRRLTDLVRSSSEESADESENDDENVSTKNLNNSEQISTRPTAKIDSPKIEPKMSPKQTSALGGAPISGTKIPSKRKLAVNEAFRDDQDDENNSSFQKKSKLSAIPEPIGQPSPTTTPVKNAAPTPTASNAQSVQIQEEKRQAVKKLIESIPTKKEDLFTFPLDWSLLDASLMDKRIKPWVTKKIVEYIGEEEASLTDFICGSIMAKNNAEKILSDIRLVLDDEAEVFVVKMWRLIVYEIEAKRQGLSK